MSKNKSVRSRMPTEWESASDDWEYVPLKLPPDVTRVTASMRLAGWELSRVRLYTDGSRKVLLKRKKTAHHVPDPGL